MIRNLPFSRYNPSGNNISLYKQAFSGIQFYKISPLTDENLKIALDNEVGVSTEYQLREYNKKFYNPSYQY